MPETADWGALGEKPEDVGDVRALYVHVPFCAAKCRYCDFDSRPCREPEALGAYVRRMRACLRHLGDGGALSACRTAYVGGGTPSLLGRALPDLVADIRRVAPGIAELTCEANPESFDAELAGALVEAGATRVSLGVQSLRDAELLALGRVHTADRAREAVRAAGAAGLDVSADLMCGIPLQTAESWQASLRGVLELGVEHVSVYPLTLEEGTPLERAARRDEALEPDEDFQARCMEDARRMLRACGLAPYEVASYARPGKRCRHNLAYWTGENYLGLGRSAASMLSRATYEALRSLLGLPAAPEGAARLRFTQLTDALPGGKEPPAYEVEGLSAREAAAEDLMLALRLTDGAPAELLAQAKRVIPPPALNRAVRTAVAEGLAAWTEAGNLVPTERGWLMGNELYELFWDLA